MRKKKGERRLALAILGNITNIHVVMVTTDLVEEVLECDWVLSEEMLRCLWEDTNLQKKPET